MQEFVHQRGETTTILAPRPVNSDGARIGYAENQLAASDWTLTMEICTLDGSSVASVGDLTNPKAVNLFSSDGDSWRAAWTGSETDELTAGCYLWKLTATNNSLTPEVTIKETLKLRIVNA